MKLLIKNTILAAMTSAALAGPSQDPVVAPAAAPTLGDWFVGGSYGQINDADNLISSVGGLLGLIGGYGGYAGLPIDDLDGIRIGDLDFDLYSLHIGQKLNQSFLGWDTSVYFELAYLDGSMGVGAYSDDLGGFVGLGIDLKVMPITANIKFERQLWQKLSVYATGGLGFAYTDLSASGLGQSFSGDDIEFFMQMSFGLSYEVVENVDVYGGVRWLRLSDMDFGTNIPLELVDDQFAWEFGVRYHF
jgi:opacity protein-like surface antigen